MRRRQRQYHGLHGESAGPDDLGRFRKRDPYDCGRPGCQLCHYEKVHGVPSAAQRRADDAFVAGLDEQDER